MSSAKQYDEASLREDVIWAARQMWEKGYVVGAAGNISARLGDTDRILITASEAPYDSMLPEDLILCTMGGEKLAGNGKPSSEILLHTGIYRARAETKAIVHTHSPYATALSVSRMAIPFCLDELYFVIGPNDVPVAPFAKSGTPELARNVVDTLGTKYRAILLANHGTVALGAVVREAFEIAEEIEKAAMIFILANLVGGATTIEEYYTTG